MTRVTVRWTDSGHGPPAPWHFAPVLLIGEHVEMVLAPAESIEVQDRVVRAIVDIPGFQRYERTIEVPDANPFTVNLSGTDLTARPGQDARISKDTGAPDGTRRLAVTIAPWAGPNVNELSADPAVALNWAGEGVTISRQSDSALSLAIDIATRFMPRRQLAIPPVGPADSCTLSWHQPPGSVPRPRVEPADAGGQLLMGYLLAGQYPLAAAAARGIEAARGAASLISWSAPSYTQLLIGYAYALGRDTARLSAWCRRTAAADALGTDGLILAAAAAWQRSNAGGALTILVRAAGSVPPTLTFGAELGLRLASVLPLALRSASSIGPSRGQVIDYTSVGEGGQELIQIMNDWVPLMTRADASAGSVSVPQTGNTRPDVANAPVFARLRWLARYRLSLFLRRYNKVLRPGLSDRAFLLVTKRRFSMARQPDTDTGPHPETGKVTRAVNEVFNAYGLLLRRLRLIWIPVFLLAIWGLGSYFYETQKSSASLSLIYGSVLAIVFVSAGAVGVGWILNARVAESERRALAAERLAEQYRNDAAKGRALAAALLASDAPEGPTAFPGADIRRQQAQFARLLFGDLVVQSPSRENSSDPKL